MDRHFEPMVPFDTACTARELKIERAISDQLKHTDSDLLTQHKPIKQILASTYLCHTSNYIDGLMTAENFNDIVAIARFFPGNLTSFLGFECRLGNQDTRSDWAFAISGIGHDRNVFHNLLSSSKFPEKYLSHPLWQQILVFTDSWVNKSSPLSDKIQCFWLEFDMPRESPEIPIPSIFFGPVRLPAGVRSNDVEYHTWIYEQALPLLKGKELSVKLKHQMRKCIENLPTNAYLFQVGTMLSRESKTVRFHINRLDPMQIMPYLESIGWYDETGELTIFLGELADKVDRFVISYDITEEGINPRIGIELSYTNNLEEQYSCWNNLFSYFIEKGWCLPEKRDSLLKYAELDNQEYFTGAVLKPIVSAAKDLKNLTPRNIVRYINHAKLVYEQGKILEAKAYPAVRLFEKPD